MEKQGKKGVMGLLERCDNMVCLEASWNRVRGPVWSHKPRKKKNALKKGILENR